MNRRAIVSRLAADNPERARLQEIASEILTLLERVQVLRRVPADRAELARGDVRRWSDRMIAKGDDRELAEYLSFLRWQLADLSAKAEAVRSRE